MRYDEKCRGGKCGSGLFGTKMQGVENAGDRRDGKCKSERHGNQANVKVSQDTDRYFPQLQR